MKIKLLVCFSLLFLLSGCYNYRELNDIAIVSAIGIDKKDDLYDMTFQIMNTKKGGNDSNSNEVQPKFITYNASGKTVQGISRKIILESPRRLYLNHIQVLIISEKLAKEGIVDILDWFARDSESRKDFYVLISKDPDKVLNTLTSIETLNSKKIADNIKTDSKFLGIAEETTFENVLADYINDKKELVLPSIKLSGDTKKADKSSNIETTDPDAKIYLSNMAVFKDDKMLGYLTSDESLAMSFIKNKIKNTIIEYKCDNNNYVTSELFNVKTKIEAQNNNKPKVKIKVKGSANINEINCDLDLENSKTIRKINNELNNKIENLIVSSIYSINNKYSTDIFGFEELFYKKDTKYYEKIKNNWTNDNFKNLAIDVDADINLSEKGTILRVIKHDKK